MMFWLMMIGVIGSLGQLALEQAVVDDDLPADRVDPGRFTWAASSSRPASGSSGVSVAPGSGLASLWSRLAKSTVPSGFVRPPIVMSPLPTRTRSPCSVPSTTSPVRFTGVTIR